MTEPRLQIVPLDPEICDVCDQGIVYLTSYDGRRMCRNCVREESDKLPTPVQREPEKWSKAQEEAAMNLLRAIYGEPVSVEDLDELEYEELETTKRIVDDSVQLRLLGDDE